MSYLHLNLNFVSGPPDELGSHSLPQHGHDDYIYLLFTVLHCFVSLIYPLRVGVGPSLLGLPEEGSDSDSGPVSCHMETGATATGIF